MIFRLSVTVTKSLLVLVAEEKFNVPPWEAPVPLTAKVVVPPLTLLAKTMFPE